MGLISIGKLLEVCVLSQLVVERLAVDISV